jgi:hypothetical protein
MFASFRECDVGSSDEVFDCAGDEDLSGSGDRPNAGCDVNGESTEVISSHFALSGMKPGPDFDPKRFDHFDNGASTPYCAGGTVERSEKSVPGRLDLAAAEVSQLLPHQTIVAVEDTAPTPITH